jgi:hypothetical protein
MSFFHKKMSQNLWTTIMPFGPVTNILPAQKKNFGTAKGWPSFQALRLTWACVTLPHLSLCHSASPEPVSLSLTWSSGVNIPYQFYLTANLRQEGRGQNTIGWGFYIQWVGVQCGINNNSINSIQIFIFICMKIMIYDKCKTKCNKTGQIKIHIKSMEYTCIW